MSKIKPEQVPLKAALTLAGCVRYTLSANDARECVAAALNAWPGMITEHREMLNFGNNIDGPIVSAKRVPFLILPHQQESTDDR